MKMIRVDDCLPETGRELVLYCGTDYVLGVYGGFEFFDEYDEERTPSHWLYLSYLEHD